MKEFWKLAFGEVASKSIADIFHSYRQLCFAAARVHYALFQCYAACCLSAALSVGPTWQLARIRTRSISHAPTAAGTLAPVPYFQKRLRRKCSFDATLFGISRVNECKFLHTLLISAIWSSVELRQKFSSDLIRKLRKLLRKLRKFADGRVWPRSTVGELTTLPQTPSRLGRGHSPCRRPTPADSSPVPKYKVGGCVLSVN